MAAGVLLIMVLTTLFVQKLEGRPGRNDYFYSHLYDSKYAYGGGYKHHSECNSDLLTCVPAEDCDRICPPEFVSIGGACYLFREADKRRARTIGESRDYCSDQGARLGWFEDSTEWSTVLATLDPLAEAADGVQFLDAEYSQEQGKWVWKASKEKLDPKILFAGTQNGEANANLLLANRKDCIAVDLKTSLLSIVNCWTSQGYICKIGEFGSRCAKSSTNRCCFIPTYKYYIRQQQPGSSDALTVKPGSCRVNFAGSRKSCQEARTTLAASGINTYRIKSSFYYLKKANTSCDTRFAVIPNNATHLFIMRYLASLEVPFQNATFRIGLTFSVEDERAYWVNGLRSDYYNAEHWYPGEPQKGADKHNGCVAYDRKLHYNWALFSQAQCGTFFGICEIPIITSTPLIKEKACGQRKERGILARSSYSIYDDIEANPGEFPWQAAIFYPSRRHGETRLFFACSGALIKNNFVLTSAHCVSGIHNKDLVVYLGEHDLNSERSLLEPVAVAVDEVIYHQGYRGRHYVENDIALLRLNKSVDVSTLPHIGLGCLPDHNTLYQYSGGWECYVIGWPSQKYGRRVLHRVDSEFLPRTECEKLTKRNYRTYVPSYRNLICTKPTEQDFCIDDQTPILVCRKFSDYVIEPFSSPSMYGYSYGEGYDKHSGHGYREYSQESARDEFLYRYNLEMEQSNTVPNFYGHSDVPYHREHYKYLHHYGEKPGNLGNHGYENSDYYSSLSDSNDKGYNKNYGYHDDSDLYQSDMKLPSATYYDYGGQPVYVEDIIVNAYGKKKFNEDTWYIVGIGSDRYSCQSFPVYNQYYYKSHAYVNDRNVYNVQAFTKVHEYINFIDFIVGLESS